MTKKGKLTVIQISQTKDIDIKNVRYIEERAIIEKGKEEPQFEADSIFRLKVFSTGPLAPLKNKLSLRKAAVFWIEGKTSCEKLKSKDELLEPITNEDRKNVVRREIAKTIAGFKGLKTWMFAAIIALLVIVLIMQLLIMGGARI
jgi:hypothetical protein